MKINTDNIESSSSNHIKAFLYIFCAILFSSILVLCLIYYYNSSNYKFRNIVLRPSVQQCGKDFSREIKTTRTFVEKLINSYQDVIEKEINPESKKYFVLAKGNNISARAIFSTASETFLTIYPSSQKNFIVESTKYPVQIYLFLGLDQNDVKSNSTIPYEYFLENYNNLNAMIHVSVQIVEFDGLLFLFDGPKIFSFSKNSLVSLNNIVVGLKDSDGKAIHYEHVEYLGFITGEKDFSFAIEIADKLGIFLAERQIASVFARSEYFRKALLDEHLSAKAKEINLRYSRTEKDSTYNYPLWKFKEDVSELRNEAKRYGMDTGYIDDLLKYPTNQPKDGYLLWYYPSHFWFSVQWTFINACLLLMYILLIILKKWNSKFAILINKIWSKLIILSIPLTINTWIFRERPKYMNIVYLIIPSALLITCFLLTVLKSDRNKSPK